MSKGIFSIPKAINEKIIDYKNCNFSTKKLKETYDEMYKNTIEIPQFIGSEKIFSGNKISIHPPHDHQKTIGYWHMGNKKDVLKAIETSLDAKKNWSNLSWENRASIFLKAADLISGPYRKIINAATMICQSKNVFQSEIDAACELVDFLRFNVKYMEDIYKDQPISVPGIWNRIEYRPLEGFVLAITPFNFTAISANLPSSMAIMGNVVIWKPSDKQIYSANIIMDVFKKAGLPDGVINMVLVDGNTIGEVVFNDHNFAGIHFTGSTKIFQRIWEKIGKNIFKYKNYPRIVGETGGKDFIWSDKSACKNQLVTALLRGAFEYQGQKCSAVSRSYIPMSIWNKVKISLIENIKSMKIGSPRDFSNFINAVIDKESFNKIKEYIERAKKNKNVEFLIGGECDDSKGYFISPTLLRVYDPYYETMTEEIFGPVLSIYVYDDVQWRDSLDLVNNTSNYALTGAIFANDRYIIEQATKILIDAAGNFYINDKPTGAVVGQQPFGGGRSSGTNDKAGSKINMLRWVSARTIKENFLPDTDYRY